MTEIVELHRRNRPSLGSAAVLVVLAAAVLAAAFVDRFGPAASLASPHVQPPSTGGVWACPIVSVSGSGGWLNLVNVSVEPSRVRVQWIRPPLKPLATSTTVAARHAMTLRAPASNAMVSAIVEWGGGQIVASRAGLMRTPVGRTVAFGAACSEPGDPLVVAPALSTVGADSQIVLLNPSAAEALADVSFVVDGDELTPQNTHARLVPPRGRIVIRAGDFVFDKGRFAAVVRTTTGTLVADVEVSTGTSASLVTAAPPLFAGSTTEHLFKGARLEIVAIGDDPSTVDLQTISSRSRGAASGLPPALDPDSPIFVRVRNTGPFAMALDAHDGSPISAALVYGLPTANGGDSAIEPVRPAAGRWVGVVGPPAPSSLGLRLAVANPGDRPATFHVTLFTPAGAASAPRLASVTLPAGRASTYVLSSVRSSVIGVEISSDVPVAASLAGTGGQGGGAFLYAGGIVGVASFGPVPALLDDRAGVDAP